MTEPVVSEAQLERRTWLRVLLICAVAFPVVAATNVLTILTDGQRSGAEPWVLELTSAVSALLLVPAVAAVERRFPLVAGRMLPHGLLLAASSVPFSLLHVGVMVGLRKLLIPMLLGQPYAFFDEPFADLLYEFSKDLFSYGVIIGLLTLSRQIELGRQELAAARAEARESGRLTLKSGGRTIHLRAADFVWAGANGNYVDLFVAERKHLPRITLSDLEQLLRSAEVDVVRVHRSRLVNADRIIEVRPTRSGDMEIRLDTGAIVKGSRRYREGIGDAGLGQGRLES